MNKKILSTLSILIILITFTTFTRAIPPPPPTPQLGNITLEAVPSTVDADGTSFSTIIATLTDTNNQPFTGANVYFTSDLGNLSTTYGQFSQGWLNISDDQGKAYAIIRSNSPGTATITATSSDVTGQKKNSSVQVIFMQLPQPPATEGKVTGGGWIVSPLSDNGKAGFGFEAQNNEDKISGSLQYTDHVNGMKVHGNVTSLSIDMSSMHAKFSGTATINGKGEYAYTVMVHDLGEPGRMVDHFHIIIRDFMGGYDAHGKLTEGNIQIHVKPGRE